MQKLFLMIGVFTTFFGCSDTVCADAADVEAACLSESVAPSEAECGTDVEACEAQCIVDNRGEYCDISRNMASIEVMRAYDACVGACSSLTTGTEKEMTTPTDK